MNTETRKIRVLQVGCGGITDAWIPEALKQDGMTYVGLCDLNPIAAEDKKRKFGLPESLPVFTDLKSALIETAPDAIFDCTIPIAHTPNAVLAFEHGVHVLSEKPLSDSLENARRALAAATAHERIYAVTQNYRYSQAPRRLRTFLDSGVIGRITTINADMYLAPHFGGFRDTMKHVLLLDMAIHTFDMARFLSGSNARSVYCHEWNPPGSWFAHDASVASIFEMANGAVFNFRGSWCATGLPTGFNSSWRVIGEKGTITWDGGNGFQCEVESGNEGFFHTVQTIEIPNEEFAWKAQGHGGIIHEFLQSLKHYGHLETSAADNIHSFAMVQKAIESSQSQQKVEF